MKVVPLEKLEASVEVPSNQIGFVKVGMPVDISIDSYPATDFGVVHGEVKSIGSDALPPNQLENRSQYRYPAMIRLSINTWNLKMEESFPSGWHEPNL